MQGGRDTDTGLPDSLTLVLISLQLLQGGGSLKRQFILSTTMDVLQSIGSLDINFLRIRKHMLKLATVTDFHSIVEEVTNCSFLYWRKEIMGSCFSMVYMDVIKFSWLQNLLDAFSDGLWLLKLGHVGKLTLHSFENEIESALENEIIAPFCRDVETDLRLHVHSSHLKGSVYVNPTKTGVRNLSWYLQMRPLRLLSKSVDVRSLLESYLNSAFYNHTAMSSNDWKMYSEMQQLAELKYGLALDDIHLTEHSQNFDINEVIQNLPTFVEKYSYSMVRQIFILKFPNDQSRKNLKLIDIDCVASSIAIRGSRILSTASSCIFQYLSQMLATLSEYLKEKFVRSYLVQESNFWKSDKEGKLNPDLFLQGEFSKIVGKSSLGGHGSSFLEEFRLIITKMGNALGLMRILLAGSSRHCCNVSRFISRPISDVSFVENLLKLGLSEEGIVSGRLMDTVKAHKCESGCNIETLSFTINTFSKEFQSSRHHELGEFFLIIPSLLLNMVDSKVHYKDKKFVKDHDLGTIVNVYDGFTMGAAFVLKVTGQETLFDGLDWFASVKKTLEEAVSSLQERGRGPGQKGSSIAGFKLWSQPTPMSPEAQMGIDKFRSYHKEIELIECEFNIARTIMSSD